MNFKPLYIIFFTLISFSLNAQVTVSATYENDIPTEIGKDYFFPVKIFFSKDSVIKGFGSFASTDYKAIRYIKEKSDQKNIKNWDVYTPKDAYKIQIKLEDEDKTYESVKVKGQGIFYLHKEYSNNSISLYSRKTFSTFLYLKKNHEDKAVGLIKKYEKIFKDCPLLYKKIKKKEFENSMTGIIDALNFYDKMCVKKM